MLKSLMDFLRRQFPIILFFVLIGIGLGVTYVLTTPPMFTAHTSMIIDTQKAQIFRRQEQPSGNNVIASAMVDSEVEMLKSENVSLAVIKRFHLADDPEFVGRNGGLFQRCWTGSAFRFTWARRAQIRIRAYSACCSRVRESV